MENVSDGDNEDVKKDPGGEDCQRLALQKEGGEVRKLIDPLLPSSKEVDEHWIGIHFP